jgi:hypothetical protein
MAAIEIREYTGDFEDLVEFTQQVWVGEYFGRTWIPVPVAAFLRGRFAPQSEAICLVAYQGTKLVGSIASVPQLMRIGGKVHPIAMFTWLTVDPQQRRVALPLIERLRRMNEERGIDLALGMVIDEPQSASFRFWKKYAEAFPHNFRFIFRGGYWGKMLAPSVLAKAGIEAWERVANRALGPFISFLPFGADARVRAYRPSDFERCLQMLQKSAAGFDWATEWRPAHLSYQLSIPEYQTFVFEADGQVKGMIACTGFPMLGREPIRAATINLWADDGLSGLERIRFLSHVCTRLRESGVHAVVAGRSGMMPAGAFLANLFVPASQRFHLGVFPTARDVPLSTPGTYSLELT